MCRRSFGVFRSRWVRFSLVLSVLSLGLGMTDLSDAYAVTYDLTGNALGLSEGNKGTSLTVSPELTLHSLTYGNQTGYPSGTAGTVYLDQTDGTGVQTTSWWKRGYTTIDGESTGAYESLVFDFSTAIGATSTKLWLNKIHHHGCTWVDIWIKPVSGSALSVPNLLNYFHSTGGNASDGTLSGYFNFSEIPGLSGVGSIERIIVRAGYKAKFYVKKIECDFYLDNDDDGYPADQDCDDENANVHPGAAEVCNEIDDDCDGSVDEGCTIYYRDADGDGYGKTNESIPATSPIPGYVATSGDCNDNNAYVHPGATEICNGIDDDCDGDSDEGCTLWYWDEDGDTFGVANNSSTYQHDKYTTQNSGDCDDTQGDINPGVPELCNGTDDNCEGTIDEGCRLYFRDVDEDTWGDPFDVKVATSPPTGYVPNGSDCDDTNAAINPDAPEVCNLVDDNCDGDIDEGCTTYYDDDDGDGYGDPADPVVDTTAPDGYVPNYDDCDDTDELTYPGAPETCDGADNDCDGNSDEGCATYYRDADGDGFGNPAESTTATSQPSGYVANAGDCNDSNAAIKPGATEVCNSVDDNCDGNTDEGCATYYQDADSDGVGNSAVTQVDTSAPPGYVSGGGDCNDNDNTVYPGAAELCDGKDNDCDTQIDENCPLQYRDADGDGYGNPGGPTSTYPQSGYVDNASDCNDSNAAIKPGATEVCNGMDDDCDGMTDEGCTTYYQDSDNDGFGNPAISTTATTQPSGYVVNAGDCNDNNAGINPGAAETCNGVDDNCDTHIDEGCFTYYRDEDNDGFGDSENTVVGGATPPAGYVVSDGDCNDANDDVYPGATEQCNGVNDDCDGATDEGCVTYYQDADGDGYGNPDVTQTVNSPAPPPGYIATDGDCDDTNPEIHVGATEVIDSVDNNCNGQVDEGLCSGDCSPCDVNDDGICDEVDLAIFGASHGWDDWDCVLNGDVECICDLVAPNLTCDGLDGICFTNAYTRPECRTSLYVERTRPKSVEPTKAIRILGKGFGNGSGGGQYSVVHIGSKEFEFGNSRIKLWSDTEIKVRLPRKSCQWFQGQDSRNVKVWVTVGGQDSNTVKAKVLKPDTCP
jgi:hypothetical protein